MQLERNLPTLTWAAHMRASRCPTALVTSLALDVLTLVAVVIEHMLENMCCSWIICIFALNLGAHTVFAWVAAITPVRSACVQISQNITHFTFLFLHCSQLNGNLRLFFCTFGVSSPPTPLLYMSTSIGVIPPQRLLLCPSSSTKFRFEFFAR
jgi:hypothetical protein